MKLRQVSPLLFLLAAQALLLFSNLGLLPLWSDELFTLHTIAQPPARILRIVAADIHPPLYYLLLHLWPWHSIEGLRAFSVLCALAATVLLDRFWTRAWRPSRRLLALALFAFSPALLLYGRMARSYSLQLVLTLAAASLLWRWYRARSGPLPALAASAALLYTHYVPGLALLAAFAVVALRRLGLARLAGFYAAAALAYAPWLSVLFGALSNWQRSTHFSAHYLLTGAAPFEHLLKIAFAWVSLSLGESAPWPIFLLAPLAALLVLRGLGRAPRPLAALVVLATLIAYLGAARWVSYPFVGARLLWLLPFLLLALVLGAGRRRWLVYPFLAASALSGYSYFRLENFLNPGFTAPLREIAARLNAEAQPADLILADIHNTDGDTLPFYLNGRVPSASLHLGHLDRLRPAARAAQTVFLVRNPRDISPGRAVSAFEDEACQGRTRRTELYEPLPPLQRWALAHLLRQPQTHFYQLTVCSTPGAQSPRR